MSNQMIIKLCTISASMGGETKDCDNGKFITSEQIQTFIEKYTTGEYIEHYDVYPLNDLGMQQIEKMGKCYSHGCDKYHVTFEFFESLDYFSFEVFESGTFPNKFYSDEAIKSRQSFDALLDDVMKRYFGKQKEEKK